MSQRLVVVVGMHRSGTSALTEALAASSGLAISTPDRLLGPAESNPRGHFEDAEIVGMNDWILEEHDAKWDDPWGLVGVEPLPGEVEQLRARWSQLLVADDFLIKDPRLCLTLPWWLRVWPASTTAVVIVRHPTQVAQSLYRRNGIPLVLGELLWYEYMAGAIKGTTTMPRIWVEHGALISNPERELTRVLRWLEVPRGEERGAVDASTIVSALITATESGDAIIPQVDTLWRQVRRIAREGGDWTDEDPAPLPGHYVELGRIAARALHASADRADVVARLASATARAESAEALADAREEATRNAEALARAFEADRDAVQLRFTTEVTTTRKTLTSELRASEVERDAAVAELVATQQTLQAIFQSRRWRLAEAAKRPVLITRRARRRARRWLRSSGFDPNWYLANNPDVAEGSSNPLIHYIRYGRAEGRDASADDFVRRYFDADFYVSTYSDVRLARVDPWRHYRDFGRTEGRDPNGVFDVAWYQWRYPDIADLDPFLHYLLHGRFEGRQPSPLFVPSWYRTEHADVRAEPFDHYWRIGRVEGAAAAPIAALVPKTRPDLVGRATSRNDDRPAILLIAQGPPWTIKRSLRSLASLGSIGLSDVTVIGPPADIALQSVLDRFAGVTHVGIRDGESVAAAINRAAGGIPGRDLALLPAGVEILHNGPLVGPSPANRELVIPILYAPEGQVLAAGGHVHRGRPSWALPDSEGVSPASCDDLAFAPLGVVRVSRQTWDRLGGLDSAWRSWEDATLDLCACAQAVLGARPVVRDGVVAVTFREQTRLAPVSNEVRRRVGEYEAMMREVPAASKPSSMER